MKKEKGYFQDLAPTQSARQVYICGPLNDLPEELRDEAKKLYARVADLCRKELGVRAYVPHEHFDPEANPDATPEEVEREERAQQSKDVCPLVIAIALAGSWGGGIEVETAKVNEVPVLLAIPGKRDKDDNLVPNRISRRLLGSPAIHATLIFENDYQLLKDLRPVFLDVFNRGWCR